MQSKNKRTTQLERDYLLRVKELPCSVCDASGPSEAHHIKQSSAYTCIALCKSCHTGYNGIHGTKALWRIKKMEELDALSVTIGRLTNGYERHDGDEVW